MHVDDATAQDEHVRNMVRDALAELVAPDLGFVSSTITTDMSIFEDLGLDSLTMVDLTLVLEEKLSIPEFPMQAWADAESTRAGRRYTVGSLVEWCSRLLSGR